jgi:hypothetical protein
MSGALSIDSAGSYPLQLSSSQRYQLRVRNTAATAQAAGWWLAHDTAGSLFFHADSTGDRAYLTSAGNLVSTGDIRSPLFYDSNDTGYYVDPNLTTNLNNLTVNGSFNAPGVVRYYQQTAAPAGPNNGDEWYSTTEGVMYKRIEDAWVQQTPAAGIGIYDVNGTKVN